MARLKKDNQATHGYVTIQDWMHYLGIPFAGVFIFAAAHSFRINSDGYLHMTLNNIANRFNMSPRVANKYLKQMVKMGILEERLVTNGPTKYRVIEELWDATPPKEILDKWFSKARAEYGPTDHPQLDLPLVQQTTPPGPVDHAPLVQQTTPPGPVDQDIINNKINNNKKNKKESTKPDKPAGASPTKHRNSSSGAVLVKSQKVDRKTPLVKKLTMEEMTLETIHRIGLDKDPSQAVVIAARMDAYRKGWKRNGRPMNGEQWNKQLGLFESQYNQYEPNFTAVMRHLDEVTAAGYQLIVFDNTWRPARGVGNKAVDFLERVTGDSPDKFKTSDLSMMTREEKEVYAKENGLEWM